MHTTLKIGRKKEENKTKSEERLREENEFLCMSTWTDNTG